MRAGLRAHSATPRPKMGSTVVVSAWRGVATGYVQEAMDRLVGVILSRLVGEVGDDGGLVDERSGQRLRRTRVEPSVAQAIADKGVEESLRADFQGMRNAEHRSDIRHYDALHDYPGHCGHVPERVGTRRVSRAYGEQPKVGMFSCQRRHPQRSEILHLPVGEHGIDLAAVEERSVNHRRELLNRPGGKCR